MIWRLGQLAQCEFKAVGKPLKFVVKYLQCSILADRWFGFLAQNCKSCVLFSLGQDTQLQFHLQNSTQANGKKVKLCSSLGLTGM